MNLNLSLVEFMGISQFIFQQKVKFLVVRQSPLLWIVALSRFVK